MPAASPSSKPPLSAAELPTTAATSPARPAAPSDDPASAAAKAPVQPRNPLHGITLEQMLVALVEHFGWDELGQQIALRCFTHEPSIKSSLKLLRKTPWARDKVEQLYLFMLREQRRNALAAAARASAHDD